MFIHIYTFHQTYETTTHHTAKNSCQVLMLCWGWDADNTFSVFVVHIYICLGLLWHVCKNVCEVFKCSYVSEVHYCNETI